MSKKQLNTPVSRVVDSIGKGYYQIYNYKKGGLANGRDLGGLKTVDSRIVKHGKFIRSGKLCKLNKREIKSLLDANVKTIIDLRVENEKQSQPDTIIKGIKYISIPILCATTTGITREKSMYRVIKEESGLLKKVYNTADDYFMSLYEFILFSPETQRQLKKCLEIIMNEQGCVLWHCAAGKDRAGLVAMLVEGMLGVTEFDIINDYLLSQQSQKFKKFMQKAALSIFTLFTFGFKLRNILFAMIDAKVEYITSAINVINKKHGSIENYCIEALGISKQKIEEFKKKNLQ